LDFQLKHGFTLCVPDTATTAMPIAGELSAAKDVDRLDVGVVRLAPESVAALQAFGCAFLRADSARQIDPRSPPPGGYVLFGFPEDLAEQAPDGALAPESLYYSCTPWKGDARDLPSLEFDPAIHLALSLEREVKETLTGRPATLPRLHGMSGCSVWHAYAPQHRDGEIEWSAEAPRLIGVQSSVYPPQGAVKVVPWTIVKKLIVQRWPDLGASLELVPANSAIVREVVNSGMVAKR
jgi:hypothetical protein